MSDIIEKVEKLSLPLIILEDMVAFPSEIINFQVKKDDYGSHIAASEAADGSRFAFALPLVDSGEGEKIPFDVGTVIKIKEDEE